MGGASSTNLGGPAPLNRLVLVAPMIWGMGEGLMGDGTEPDKQIINPVALALMAALALGGFVLLSVMMMP
jgi:hypothetical protein